MYTEIKTEISIVMKWKTSNNEYNLFQHNIKLSK